MQKANKHPAFGIASSAKLRTLISYRSFGHLFELVEINRLKPTKTPLPCRNVCPQTRVGVGKGSIYSLHGASCVGDKKKSAQQAVRPGNCLSNRPLDFLKKGLYAIGFGAKEMQSQPRAYRRPATLPSNGNGEAHEKVGHDGSKIWNQQRLI